MPRPSSEDDPRLASRNADIRMLRRKYDAPIAILAAIFGLTERQVYRILAEGPEEDRGESRDMPAGLCSVA
jgi:hypothetical protein